MTTAMTTAETTATFMDVRPSNAATAVRFVFIVYNLN